MQDEYCDPYEELKRKANIEEWRAAANHLSLGRREIRCFLDYRLFRL